MAISKPLSIYRRNVTPPSSSVFTIKKSKIVSNTNMQKNFNKLIKQILDGDLKAEDKINTLTVDEIEYTFHILPVMYERVRMHEQISAYKNEKQRHVYYDPISSALLYREAALLIKNNTNKRIFLEYSARIPLMLVLPKNFPPLRFDNNWLLSYLYSRLLPGGMLDFLSLCPRSINENEQKDSWGVCKNRISARFFYTKVSLGKEKYCKTSNYKIQECDIPYPTLAEALEYFLNDDIPTEEEKYVILAVLSQDHGFIFPDIPDLRGRYLRARILDVWITYHIKYYINYNVKGLFDIRFYNNINLPFLISESYLSLLFNEKKLSISEAPVEKHSSKIEVDVTQVVALQEEGEGLLLNIDVEENVNADAYQTSPLRRSPFLHPLSSFGAGSGGVMPVFSPLKSPFFGLPYFQLSMTPQQKTYDKIHTILHNFSQQYKQENSLGSWPLGGHGGAASMRSCKDLENLSNKTFNEILLGLIEYLSTSGSGMRKGSLDERLYEALMEETEVLQPFMQGISEVAQLGAKIKGKERFQTHHRAQLFLSQQEKQFIQENFIKREQLVLALKGMVEERKATELKTQSSFNNGH